MWAPSVLSNLIPNDVWAFAHTRPLCLRDAHALPHSSQVKIEKERSALCLDFLFSNFFLDLGY